MEPTWELEMCSVLLTGCFAEWINKESTIEQRMHKAREYAERIHKLSKKVDWEMVKLCHKSTESYNEMIDAKQALQEAHKELNEAVQN